MKWQSVTFGDAFEIQLGKMLDKQKNVGELRPYLGNRDVQWGKCNTSNLAEMRLSVSDRERFLLQPGDLLVCEGGEVGRTAIWNGERDDCYYQKAIHRLRPKCSIEPRFVLHYMRWAADRNLFAHLTSSTSIAHLTKEKLQQAQIPLPHKNGKLDLAEQKRIAAILDKADAIRRKLQESLRLSDGFLRSVFLDMFGDPVTNPKEWETVELQDAVKKGTIVTYGIVQAGTEFPGGVPYIRTGDIVNGVIRLNGLRRTDPSIAKKFERSKVRTGEIVMSIRATVGTTAVVTAALNGANLTQGTARISPGEKTLLPFLLFYLRSEGVQGWIQKQVKGATFAEITLGRLRELPVLVPPIANQKRFAAAYEKLEKVKAAQQKQLLDSSDLFSSLQQRAFRGEL